MDIGRCGCPLIARRWARLVVVARLVLGRPLITIRCMLLIEVRHSRCCRLRIPFGENGGGPLLIFGHGSEVWPLVAASVWVFVRQHLPCVFKAANFTFSCTLDTYGLVPGRLPKPGANLHCGCFEFHLQKTLSCHFYILVFFYVSCYVLGLCEPSFALRTWPRSPLHIPFYLRLCTNSLLFCPFHSSLVFLWLTHLDVSCCT